MICRPVILTTAVTIVVLLLAPAARASDSSGQWSWPLDDRRLGKTFDPPATDYGAGHRGIDISASIGDVVRAVAAGQVTFAGLVGGIPVITISHGAERSTYQPVQARVQVGDSVEARQVIGVLLGAPSHCSGACLHLGRLVGKEYLDPLELLGRARLRLVTPDGAPPKPPPPPPLSAGPDGGGSGQSTTRPVGGPITSAFGMRVHPITGVRKLHDGTDFGAPCGTPVHAAGSGTVVASGRDGAYGIRVTIRQGGGIETSYAHLSGASTSNGSRVRAGDVIGRVGNTGLSTGCHLHFMVIKNGSPVNSQG